MSNTGVFGIVARAGFYILRFLCAFRWYGWIIDALYGRVASYLTCIALLHGGDFHVHMAEHHCLFYFKAYGAFLDIDGSGYFIGNVGNGFENAGKNLRPFDRIVGAVGKQDIHLEFDEIHLIFGYIFFDFLGSVRLGERIGIVAVRQKKYLDV